MSNKSLYMTETPEKNRIIQVRIVATVHHGTVYSHFVTYVTYPTTISYSFPPRQLTGVFQGFRPNPSFPIQRLQLPDQNNWHEPKGICPSFRLRAKENKQKKENNVRCKWRFVKPVRSRVSPKLRLFTPIQAERTNKGTNKRLCPGL